MQSIFLHPGYCSVFVILIASHSTVNNFIINNFFHIYLYIKIVAYIFAKIFVNLIMKNDCYIGIVNGYKFFINCIACFLYIQFSSLIFNKWISGITSIFYCIYLILSLYLYPNLFGEIGFSYSCLTRLRNNETLY